MSLSAFLLPLPLVVSESLGVNQAVGRDRKLLICSHNDRPTTVLFLMSLNSCRIVDRRMKTALPWSSKLSPRSWYKRTPWRCQEDKWNIKNSCCLQLTDKDELDWCNSLWNSFECFIILFIRGYPPKGCENLFDISLELLRGVIDAWYPFLYFLGSWQQLVRKTIATEDHVCNVLKISTPLSIPF